MGVRIKPKLRVLPNGVRDEITSLKVKEIILLSSDIPSMFNGYDLLDYALVTKPIDSVYYDKQTTTLLGSSIMGDMIEFTTGYNNTNNIGKYTALWSALAFIVGFPKGTTLAQARTLLVGQSLTYQLTSPRHNLSNRIY